MTNDNISDTELKRPEPEISETDPFQDDVLKRSDFAETLTNLVKGQTEPFTISLHGQRGTGKTFLLERWKRNLNTKEKIQSIYFNAWEDDFCNDPLVAIIGQLSEFLKANKYTDTIDEIKKCIKPLMMKTAANYINSRIGVDIGSIMDQSSKNIIDDYVSQIKSRDDLKKHLKKIALQVKEKTSHPLVFIIDELDRCRPLFAIELLERIKHIFEIPNMVFILGINKDELCKSIQSVYGEINAEDYLRRFFDMDILLPEPDLGAFCDNVMDHWDLNELYSKIGRTYENPEFSEYNNFGKHFSVFCNCLGLSLRDIDYCVRVLLFVGRILDSDKNPKPYRFLYPHLIILLVILRIKEKKLYQDFIHGEYLGCEIMDFIYNTMIDKKSNDRFLSDFLNQIEAYLYQVNRNPVVSDGNFRDPIVSELNLLFGGDSSDSMKHLSKRTKKLNIDHKYREFYKEDIDQIKYTIDYIQSNRRANSLKVQIKHISNLINAVDINQSK